MRVGDLCSPHLSAAAVRLATKFALDADAVRDALVLAAAAWMHHRLPEDDLRAEPDLGGVRARERIPQLRRRLRQHPGDDAAAYELFALERRAAAATHSWPVPGLDQAIDLLLEPWRAVRGEPTLNEGPGGAVNYLSIALRAIGVPERSTHPHTLRKRLGRRR